MSQNTSHAVMAQRIEPHDSLDYFPTPPWATRALCEWIEKNRTDADKPLGDLTCWEPACGEGHMVLPLEEYFAEVRASDVHPYGFACVDDFLLPSGNRADWIITNPPFRLAEQFVINGLMRAEVGVAMLVRTTFLEGVGRYGRLYTAHPPAAVLQFTERVPMHKGRLVKDGTTATAYCWVLWRMRPDHEGTRFDWLAPCRRKLEKPEDYEVAG